MLDDLEAQTLGLALMRAGAPVRHRRLPEQFMETAKAASVFASDKVAAGDYTPQLALQPDGSRAYDLSKRACFMVHPGAATIDLSYHLWQEVKAYVDDYFDVTPAHKLLVSQSLFLYNPVGGGVGIHTDDKPVLGHPTRVVIAMTYTNEGYEGGEIEFPELGLRHKPAIGDVFIFPTCYPHRVAPLTQGVRTAWQCGYFITDASGAHIVQTK